MSKRSLYTGLNPEFYSLDGQIFHCPLISITELPNNEPHILQALSQFDDYTHVVITSKSTVSFLINHLTAAGISIRSWRNKTTLAVGKATAKYLERSLLLADAIAKQETAEGIVEELKRLELKNAHLFWPHSAKARPVIRQYCADQLIKLTECVLYDTIFLKPNPLPDLNTFEEVVFTSPSTVDAFLSVFKVVPCHLTCLTIGPVTHQHLFRLQPHANSKLIFPQ